MVQDGETDVSRWLEEVKGKNGPNIGLFYDSSKVCPELRKGMNVYS